MSNWVTPKTNWAETDYFNLTDYNRINGNHAYLHDVASGLYPAFTLSAVEEKSNASWIYPADFNTMEGNLYLINQNTEQLSIGTYQTYHANGSSMDWEELNRIESAALRLFNAMRTRADSLTYTGEMYGGDDIGIL